MQRRSLLAPLAPLALLAVFGCEDPKPESPSTTTPSTTTPSTTTPSTTTPSTTTPSTTTPCGDRGTGTEPPEVITCGDLDDPRVLVDDPDRPVDYVVDCVVSAHSEITIEPGVVIAFEFDTGLKVVGDGRLHAEGEECAPVVFEGTSPVAGHWRGLIFDNDGAPDPVNVMRHTEVHHAAGDDFNSNGDLGAIIVWADNHLVLEDSVVADSADIGLNLYYHGSSLTFARNTFTDNAGYAVFGPAEYMSAMDAESTFSGNLVDGMAVDGGNTDEGAHWAAMTQPYHVLEGAVVKSYGGLTLDPGVQVAFEADAGLSIAGDAPIVAEGTADAPIRLFAADGQPGSWRGLIIDNNGEPAVRNVLQHVEIRGGGSDDFNSNGDLGGLILWADNHLTLRDVTIAESANVGLNLTYWGSTVVLEGVNTFTDNAGPPVWADPMYASSFRSVDRLTGNGDDVLLLTEGNIDGTHRWQPLDVPYLLDSVTGIFYDIHVTTDSSLTIEAGAEVLFGFETGLSAFGELAIEGTADDPVVLRGEQPIAGYWKGILIEDTDNVSRMFFFDHLDLRDAGGAAFNSNGDLGAIIPWADTSLSLTNSVISNVGSGAPCAVNARYYDPDTDIYTLIGSTTDGSAMLSCDPEEL
jgi:hypothetical protein